MTHPPEISRANPTCFLFLVDQSSSMLEPFGAQQSRQKAEGVADAINRLLQNLVLKCTKSDGVRDYFWAGIIGYGGEVTSALPGLLAAQRLVPISALADNPLRIEQRTRTIDDGTGGLFEQVIKFPVWFEAKANGRTPMCQALTLAREYLQGFLSNYPNCYPPIVMNITDGASTDGDPRPVAEDLQGLTSRQGSVLLLNAHISTNLAYPVEFPASDAVLPDKFAKLLFHMSSLLPTPLLEAVVEAGFPVAHGARGFVFNADLVSVIRFLDIGTRVARGAR